MKKSLLALAVLGAFAGAASAQTNVTVYGLVDVAIQRFDTNVDGVKPKWSLDSSTPTNKNGSRLGFKGTEDLGGGLSAIFTIENGFKTDTGEAAQGGLLFGRQAFVGLQGGFGAVKAGRQYTPLHVALDSIDPFGTGMAGSIENVFVAGAGSRTNNTLNYSLPTIAGFSGEIAYGFGEVAGEMARAREFGLSLGYANGPIKVVLAHHDSHNGSATAAYTAKSRTTMLGGTYDLGVAKAHAAFATNRGDAVIGSIGASFDPTLTAAQATAESVATQFNEDIKTRDFMLGVSAPIGAGEVRASWARKDVRDSEAKYDQFALGYVHNLSKRTNLYTALALGKVKDDAGESNKNNLFQVGVQHKF